MNYIVDHSECQFTPWQRWFAWYPVKVHGKRAWGKYVYCRMPEIVWPRRSNGYSDFPPEIKWEYGTIFDVLKGRV